MNKLINVGYFQIRQTWLGLGYICCYNTEKYEIQIYDHDAFFQRNKEKIMNQDYWNDRTKRFICNGKDRKLIYKEKSLKWLPVEN